MSKRIIKVVDYQPDWIELFNKEREILCQCLGKTVVAVHHIGSTAIIGLAAKPIIDILVEVTSLEGLDKQVGKMTDNGYLAKGENGIDRRRYFQKGGVQRSHHIHAFIHKDEHVIRHLAFRDYLRNNPEIAQQYGEVKKKAAAQCNNDPLLYCQLKEEFMSHHERLALKE